MPGQFDTLPSGYDFRPFESKWPEISAEGYVKGQVRGWAAARGVSYHTLGNDLESVNYSSAQVGISDEREHYKAHQQDMIDWLHQDVAEQVLRRSVLYVSSLRPSQLPTYLDAISWQPRRWAPIDPNKAANADDTNLRNGLMSRRRIWAEKGLDFDDMAAEIAEEAALFGPVDPVPEPTRQARLTDPTDEPTTAASKPAKG